MFEKAELDNIDRLHHLGRQLSTLKRIYQSYTTIIESILVAQKPVHPAADVSVSSSQVLGAHRPVDQSAAMMSAGGDLSLGVALASTAIVRFARLKDRINLYALSEIQECLDEKESLVFLVRAPPPSSNPPLPPNHLPNRPQPPELQPHRAQRVPSRRAPHPHHHPPRQSHHPLPARLPPDRLLQRRRHHPGLHQNHLLVQFRRHHGRQFDVSGRLR